MCGCLLRSFVHSTCINLCHRFTQPSSVAIWVAVFKRAFHTVASPPLHPQSAKTSMVVLPTSNTFTASPRTTRIVAFVIQGCAHLSTAALFHDCTSRGSDLHCCVLYSRTRLRRKLLRLHHGCIPTAKAISAAPASLCAPCDSCTPYSESPERWYSRQHHRPTLRHAAAENRDRCSAHS